MRKGIAAAILLTILLVVLAFAFASDVHAEIRPSEVPMEYEIIGIQRVDVDLENEPLIALVNVPVLETGDYLVAITDGYHIIPSWFYFVSGQTLAALFRPSDLNRLDGTVGVYLIWLAKTGHTEN